MSAKDQQYQIFQEFQKNFFTSPTKFSQYTIFDVKKNSFMLLNNIAKGYPALMNAIMNMKGFGWDCFTSFEILRALQSKLVNPYTGYRMPSYLFFKTDKKEKVKAISTKNGLEFSMEVKRDICEILRMDSKTYEYLKYSDKVQQCGKQIIGDIKEVVKNKKNKK